MALAWSPPTYNYSTCNILYFCQSILYFLEFKVPRGRVSSSNVFFFSQKLGTLFFSFFLFLFFFLFLKSLPPRIHSSCSTVLLSISRGTDTSVFSKYSVSIRIVRRRVVTSNSAVRLRVEYLRQSSFYSGHSFFFLFTVISPVV